MGLQDGIYLPPEDAFLPFYPTGTFLGNGVVLTGKASYQKAVRRDALFGGHDVLANVFWTMPEMPFIAIESKLRLHGWFPLVCPDSLKVGRSLFQSKTEASNSGKKLNDTDLLHDRHLVTC